MNFASLGALVSRVIAWADRVQRGHGVLGFPYAVIKKYGDDDGGREAALITYYGFLSVFPLLLLGVAILSRVLASNPDLRQKLITAIVPPKRCSPPIEQSVATPADVHHPVHRRADRPAVLRHRCRVLRVPDAEPCRRRPAQRSCRVLPPLPPGVRDAGDAAARGAGGRRADGRVTALPHLAGAERAVAVLGSALVIFAVLLLSARLLLTRPAPFRAVWPAAVLGAVVVTLVLNLGPVLLARLVTKAGAVYGSFATVAGLFALLYLVSQALVYSAEVAAVRYAHLWPRALDVNHPTAADVRAMTLLAREQERIRTAQVGLRLVSSDVPPAGGGPPEPHRP